MISCIGEGARLICACNRFQYEHVHASRAFYGQESARKLEYDVGAGDRRIKHAPRLKLNDVARAVIIDDIIEGIRRQNESIAVVAAVESIRARARAYNRTAV